MLRKNKKFYLFAVLLILCGVGIRLYFASIQPIWLDEQYSIFFATQFNLHELMSGFSQDVHPGLYYLILKVAMGLSDNLLALRFITAILPQIVGILLVSWFVYRRKNAKQSLLLLAILMINPFFVHLSWQLRNYGWIFLVVSMSYVFLKNWKRTQSKLYLLLLIVTLFIGNMFHYVMVIFFLSTVIYLLTKLQNLSFRKKINLFLITVILLAIQIVGLSGFSSFSQYKYQLQKASWIQQPSAENIPGVYLTSLGFDSNVMNSSQSTPMYIIVSTYVILVFLVFIIKKKVLNKSQAKEVTLLVVLPIVTIFLTSILLPFLSNRLYIHRIIPQLSVFLPRIHLPFVLIFWIIFSQSLINKWNHRSKAWSKAIVLPVLFMVVIYWSWLNQQMNTRFYYSSEKKLSSLQEILEKSQDSPKVLLWPHWMWFGTIQPSRLGEIPKILKQQQISEQFEYLFTETKSFSCQNISQSIVYVYFQELQTQRKLQQQIITQLDNCCSKSSDVNDVFGEWRCEVN